MRPGRFLILFGACFLVGYAALITPWVKPAVITFDRVLVHASGTLIHLCRGHADASGAVLRSPSTGLAIEMKDGCNGVNVTVLLCAALLAFPASWNQKAKGLLIGCAAIQLVNLLAFHQLVLPPAIQPGLVRFRAQLSLGELDHAGRPGRFLDVGPSGESLAGDGGCSGLNHSSVFCYAAPRC